MAKQISSKTHQGASIAQYILWMTLFFLWFLPFVFMVIAAWIGAGFLLKWIICNTDIEKVGWAIILTTIIVILLLCILVPITYALVRPLISLFSKRGHEGIEITEQDAPSLVQLIYQLADMTHNKRPLHIFLTGEVNACVFFDSPASFISHPERKDITIGLGLLRHSSQAELAACLAHEFGHFSQNNLRWSQAIFLINTLTKEQMKVFDKWNSLVDNLISSPLLSDICFGITRGYTHVLDIFYKHMQLANLELSRKMEFEADDISAQIVGSKDAISFAYKSMVLCKREKAFNQLVKNLFYRNCILEKVWDAYDQTDNYLNEMTHTNLSWNTSLSSPAEFTAERKLLYEEIYSSHPDWAIRIQAINETNHTGQIHPLGKAEDLVPKSVFGKVGTWMTEQIKDAIGQGKPIRQIAPQEVHQYIEQTLRTYLYQPYFDRTIPLFDYTNCKKADSLFDPLSKENTVTRETYKAILEDKTDAENIHAGKSDIKRVLYEGKIYKAKNIPMDEINAAYEKVEASIRALDQQICESAMTLAFDPDDIQEDYRRIFYAQKFIEIYNKHVSPKREKAIALLKTTKQTNAMKFEEITLGLDKLNDSIETYLMPIFDEELFLFFAPENVCQCYQEYMEHHRTMLRGRQTANGVVSISGNGIKTLFDTCQYLFDIHLRILAESKNDIIDVLIGEE